MKDKTLKRAIALGAAPLKNAELEFFKRVWSADPSIYRRRLEAIGFSQCERILDAGCGYGQWTVPLARLNNEVVAIDQSLARVKSTLKIVKCLGLANVNVRQLSVEKLPFKADTFDRIFSYEVVMYTDFRKTLRQFWRILKPGGTMYLSIHGLGWYLQRLIEQRNRSPHYDPRQTAIDAMKNTFHYFYDETVSSPGELILTSRAMRRWLAHIGFEKIRVGPEGTLRTGPSVSARSFYAPQYGSLELVYEVLAVKKKSNGRTSRSA